MINRFRGKDILIDFREAQLQTQIMFFCGVEFSEKQAVLILCHDPWTHTILPSAYLHGIEPIETGRKFS